jgi:hypothetical protein
MTNEQLQAIRERCEEYGGHADVWPTSDILALLTALDSAQARVRELESSERLHRQLDAINPRVTRDYFAAVEADRARLNWLDAGIKSGTVIDVESGAFKGKITVHFHDGDCGRYATKDDIRSAIDAAIAQSESSVSALKPLKSGGTGGGE